MSDAQTQSVKLGTTEKEVTKFFHGTHTFAHVVVAMQLMAATCICPEKGKHRSTHLGCSKHVDVDRHEQQVLDVYLHN